MFQPLIIFEKEESKYLNPEDKINLNYMVELINQYPCKVILHSNSVAGKSAKSGIQKRRLKLARDYLIEKGVSPAVISADQMPFDFKFISYRRMCYGIEQELLSIAEEYIKGDGDLKYFYENIDRMLYFEIRALE